MVSSVRIGGVDLALLYEGGMLGRHEVLGVINHNRGEIAVEATLPKQRQIVEILHECLHAMIVCARLSDAFKNENDEERFVSVMAHHLVAFLRYNPKLLEEWGEAWTLD